MSPSVALKEVMFAAAWVSDGSTSKYQTVYVSNTPTNSWNESLPLKAHSAECHICIYKRESLLVTNSTHNIFTDRTQPRVAETLHKLCRSSPLALNSMAEGDERAERAQGQVTRCNLYSWLTSQVFTRDAGYSLWCFRNIHSGNKRVPILAPPCTVSYSLTGWH